jgi:hypothetical protein
MRRLIGREWLLRSIHLQTLKLDHAHPGLTEARAHAHAEAACVCVARHHRSPVEYTVWNQASRSSLLLEWDAPDERQLAAWANTNEATEAGAVGLVLAALEACAGLVAVRRAETRTGADYYVGPPGSGREDLEQCFRLEISGVDHGPASLVHGRVFEKVQQTLRGESNLPALVGVVGFKVSLVVLEPVEVE